MTPITNCRKALLLTPLASAERESIAILDGLKSVIPFGPYLALGAVLYAFWGAEIGDWYLNQFLMLPN